MTSLLHYLRSSTWLLEARPKQLPPPDDLDWLTWVIRTGRGFGKTRSITEWLDSVARSKPPGSQVLIAGRTPADVRDFELYGPGGLLTNHPDVEYQPSKRHVVWPNGVIGIIRSGANPEEFRGFSGDTAVLCEFAAWDYPQAAYSNLIFGMREGNPRIAIGTTPRPVPILREICKAPSTVLVTGSSYENKANLSHKYVSAVLDPLSGSTLGRREIEGEDLDDNDKSLWKRNLIENSRVTARVLSKVDLLAVVVGVDPQGKTGNQSKRKYANEGPIPLSGILNSGDSNGESTDSTRSRETGIIAAGFGSNGHYYVLSDASLSASPGKWGEAVVACFEQNRADRVIAEVNYGGDMVVSTIGVVDTSVPVETITSTRGKEIRAAPIVALYEKGLVHHVGVFSTLEDEMCNWSPQETWSPNRLDALVFALTKLMKDLGNVDLGGSGLRLNWGNRQYKRQ